MANPRGQIVPKGEAAGGKSVDEYRVMLFRWNESQWKRKPDLVLADEEMAELMKRAFPDRTWSKNLTAVNRHRAIYNRGRLKCQKKTPPKERSHRYERFAGGVRQWVVKEVRSKWPTKRIARPRTGLDKVVVMNVQDDDTVAKGK